MKDCFFFFLSFWLDVQVIEEIPRICEEGSRDVRAHTHTHTHTQCQFACSFTLDFNTKTKSSFKVEFIISIFI